MIFSLNPLLFIICALILIVLLVLFLQTLKKLKLTATFEKNWKAWAKNHKEIPLWQHVLIIVFASIVSISFYLLLIDIFKPHFTFTQTTAVNWFTVHHYPAQQDKFYFVTAFVSTLFFTILLWFLWVLQKNNQ